MSSKRRKTKNEKIGEELNAIERELQSLSNSEFLQIQKLILRCEDPSQLRKINELCCKRNRILLQLISLDFEVGDKVFWVHNKTKDNMFGTIQKVRNTSCEVKSQDNEIWRVTSSLLNK